MNRMTNVILTVLLFSVLVFCSCGGSETIEVRPDQELNIPEISQKEYFNTGLCTFLVTEETKKIPVTSETKKEEESSVVSSSFQEISPDVPDKETPESPEINEEPPKEEPPVKSQEPSSSPAPVTSVNSFPSPVSQEPSESPSASAELKYADGVLIVNKSYPVPSDYEPENLILAPGSSEEYLVPEVCDAFREMSSDAWSEGLTLWVQSGYRSYQRQNRIYNNYVSQHGREAADTFSARPGHSEHHTGLAFDLNTITDSFADTEEGKWVAANCYRYGFIIRYPKNKESITGYKYEPWHLRYLGRDLAEKVYNSGLCLEEYFGLTSQYSN